MKHPVLFEFAPSEPSKQSRLNEFKKKHGIETFNFKGMRRQDNPWAAVKYFPGDEGKSIGVIMDESVRLYEESGHAAYGPGELTAVRRLCEQLKIECEL